MIAHRFDPEHSKPPFPSIQLLHADALDYSNRSNSQPLSHILTELMYVLEGSGWFEIENGFPWEGGP